MAKYTVRMVHVIERTIDKEVEADSKEAAIELAKDYDDEDITDETGQGFEAIEVDEVESSEEE